MYSQKTSRVAVGIDIGTTECCVGVYENGVVRVIPNEKGHLTTPAYIAFTGTQRLFSSDALEQVCENYKNTLFSVKNFLGRTYKDAMLIKDKYNLPFTILEECHKPVFAVTHRHKELRLTPEQVYAMLIGKMKRLAEVDLNRQIADVILSVPSSFNTYQRQASVDAAQIAGFKNVRLINETTACAVACAKQKTNECNERCMFVNLSGGSIELALADIHKRRVHIEAVCGDRDFGADDFVFMLLQECAEQIYRFHNKIINENKGDYERLRLYCKNMTQFLLGNDCNGCFQDDFCYCSEKISFEIEKISFVSKCSYHLQNKMNLICTKDFHRGLSCEKVVLVRGCAKNDFIIQALTNLFPQTYPHCVSLENTAVVIGAAILAANLSGTDCSKLNIIEPVSRIINMGNVNLFSGNTDNRIFSIEHLCKRYANETYYFKEQDGNTRITLGYMEISRTFDFLHLHRQNYFNVFLDSSKILTFRSNLDQSELFVNFNFLSTNVYSFTKFENELQGFDEEINIFRNLTQLISEIELFIDNHFMLLKSNEIYIQTKLKIKVARNLDITSCSSKMIDTKELRDQLEYLYIELIHCVALHGQNTKSVESQSSVSSLKQAAVTDKEFKDESQKLQLTSEKYKNSNSPVMATGFPLAEKTLHEDSCRKDTVNNASSLLNTENIAYQLGNHIELPFVDKEKINNCTAEQGYEGSSKRTDKSMYPKYGPAIGIDFGTTKCCIAVVKNGKSVVLENKRGSRITPCYVAFTDTERFLGHEAKNQASMNPAGTVFGTKGLLGRNYDQLFEVRDNLPFKISSLNKKSMVEVQFKHKELKLTFEELAAMILIDMKKLAEDNFGCPVNAAVITVSSSFTDHQRQAIRDAATIAGLKLLAILNDVTATAITVANRSVINESKNILVFDYGGDTLDIGLVEIHGRSVKTVTVNYERYCGGNIIDSILLDEIAQCSTQDLKKALKNKKVATRLTFAVEKLKRDLSLLPKATLVIDSFDGNRDFSHTVTRSRFEKLLDNHLGNKLVKICSRLNHAIKIKPIKELVLVGGSSRIPYVQKLLSNYFKAALCKTLNPDECVAEGAALYAALLSGDNTVPEITVEDIVRNPERKNDREPWNYFASRDYYLSLPKYGHFTVNSAYPEEELPQRGRDFYAINHLGILEIKNFMICETSSEYQLADGDQLRREPFNSPVELRDMKRRVAEVEEEQAKYEELVIAINDLEYFCLNIKDKSTVESSKKDAVLLKECDDVLQWLETESDLTKEKIEAKRKCLELSHIP